MNGSNTKVDNLLRKIKNNPIIAIGIVICIILVSVSTFTDAIKNILDTISRKPDGLELVELRLIQDSEEIKAIRNEWFNDNQKSQFTNLLDYLNPPIDKGFFPLIDIKLKNKSNQTIFIKTLDFNIILTEGSEFIKSVLCYPQRATYAYNILIDRRVGPLLEGTSKNKYPKKVQLHISQAIKPGDVDRFFVIIGQQRYKKAIYNLDLKLQYDENRILPLGKLKATIHGPFWCVRCWQIDKVRRLESVNR